MTQLEKATIGGGCFWCIEAIYQDVQGITEVVSGYAGGHTPNPTYKQIGTGTSGHAEVTQITFDSTVISYGDILTIFWRIHDPTTLNRQGNDRGPQYRSIILTHDEIQAQIAEKSKVEAGNAGIWSNPIVTEIAPLETFYKAEAYHQNYYRSNRYQPYCLLVIDPKIRKFRKSFKDKLAA